MRATVILCTRNRAASLARTLESAAGMAPVTEAWEMLVVDNGSTDETAAVIASFAGRLPVRRVVQPLAGLSNARNAGLAEARGDYMLWTDDDVLIDAGWLAAYIAAFARWPDAALFGGWTEPLFEPPGPDWLTHNQPLLADLLAIRQFGDSPVPLTDAIVPFGLNYAIRSAEQRRHPYDVDLGVAPGRRTGGEETAVITAIRQEGGGGWWLPDARILHLIPPERQTRDYVRAYYTARGLSMARWNVADPSPTLFGLPRWRLRRLVGAALRYHALSWRRDARWLPALIEASIQRGWIAGTRVRRGGGAA